MAQKKFYIGEPIQRVLSSPNQPVFTSEYAVNGYPDSIQLNRFVQRGLDALFNCIPDISTEAWQLIMNTLPCNDQEIDDHSLDDLKNACMIMMGIDDFFDELLVNGIDDYENRQEAIEKHYKGENKDALLEVLSLSELELMGVREVVERYWSKRVYKRNNGFDMTLYDIKRSLILKPCNELCLLDDAGMSPIKDPEDELIGLSFLEGYGFNHYIHFSTTYLESMESKDFDAFMNGKKFDWQPNTFYLFGYRGSWRLLDTNEGQTMHEEYLDYVVGIEDKKLHLFDMTPSPSQGEEDLWCEKIGRAIYAGINLHNGVKKDTFF